MRAVAIIPLCVCLLSSAFAKPPLLLNYQDGDGQYNFGYSDPLSMRTESRTVDGVTRGTYSYYDQNGAIQTTEYEAGKDIGFRVKATNLPEAPLPVVETPEVKDARERHMQLLEEANRREEEEKRTLSQVNEAKPAAESAIEASAVAEAKIAPLSQDKEISSTPIIPAVDVRSQVLPEGETIPGASLNENIKSVKISESTPQGIPALPLQQQNEEQTPNLRAQPLSPEPSAPAPLAPQTVIQKQQETSSKDLPNQGPLLEPNIFPEQRAFAAHNPFLIPFLGQGFSFERALPQQRGLSTQQGQEKSTAENINSELPTAPIQSRISEQSAIPKQSAIPDQSVSPAPGVQGQPGSQIQNIFSDRAFSNQNGSPSGISIEQFPFAFPGLERPATPKHTPLSEQRAFPTQNDLGQQRLPIQGVHPQRQLESLTPNGFSGQQGFPNQDALLQQNTAPTQNALPKQQGFPTLNSGPSQSELLRQQAFPEQRTVLAQGGLPNSQVFPSASGFFGQGLLEQNGLLRHQGFLTQQNFAEQQNIPRQNVNSEQQQGSARQSTSAEQQTIPRQSGISEQQVQQGALLQQQVTPQQIISRHNAAPEQQQGAIPQQNAIFGQQFIQHQSSILDQHAIPRQNAAPEQQVSQPSPISGQQFIQQQFEQQEISRQNAAFQQQGIPQQSPIAGQQQFIQQQFEQQGIPRQNVASEQQGAISGQQFIQQQSSILNQQAIPRQNAALQQQAIPQQSPISGQQQFIQQQFEQQAIPRQNVASEQQRNPQQSQIAGQQQFIQQQFEQQGIPRQNVASEQQRAISEQQFIQQQSSIFDQQVFARQNAALQQQAIQQQFEQQINARHNLSPDQNTVSQQNAILGQQQGSISGQQITQRDNVGPEQKEITQQNADPRQQANSQESLIPDQQAIARQIEFLRQQPLFGQQNAIPEHHRIGQAPSVFDQQVISRFNAISSQQGVNQNQDGISRQSISGQQNIPGQNIVPEQRGVPQNLTPGQDSLPKGFSIPDQRPFPQHLDQSNLQGEPSDVASVRVPEPARLSPNMLNEPVKYTPEVMAAREAHFRAYAVAARLAEESDRNPQILIELLKGPAANIAQIAQRESQPENEVASRSEISTTAPIAENLNTKSAEDTTGRLSEILPEPAIKAPEQRIEPLIAGSAQAAEAKRIDNAEKIQPINLPNGIEQPIVRTGLTPASTSLRVMDTRLPSLNEFQQSKLKEALALTCDTSLKVTEDKEAKTKADQHLLIVKPIEIAPIATQKDSSMQQPVPKNWAFQYVYL